MSILGTNKCEHFHKTYLKVEEDSTLKEYEKYCTNLMRPCAEVNKFLAL